MSLIALAIKICQAESDQMLTVHYRSPVKMNRSSPFQNVTKFVVIKGTTNFNYADELYVDGRAPTYPAPRWGKRIVPGIGIRGHKSNYYLEILVDSESDPIYYDEEGKELPAEDVAPHVKGSKNRQREVDIRTLNLEHIEDLK